MALLKRIMFWGVFLGICAAVFQASKDIDDRRGPLPPVYLNLLERVDCARLGEGAKTWLELQRDFIENSEGLVAAILFMADTAARPSLSADERRALHEQLLRNQAEARRNVLISHGPGEVAYTLDMTTKRRYPLGTDLWPLFRLRFHCALGDETFGLFLSDQPHPNRALRVEYERRKYQDYIIRRMALRRQ